MSRTIDTQVARAVAVVAVDLTTVAAGPDGDEHGRDLHQLEALCLSATSGVNGYVRERGVALVHVKPGLTVPGRR